MDEVFMGGCAAGCEIREVDGDVRRLIGDYA